MRVVIGLIAGLILAASGVILTVVFELAGEEIIYALVYMFLAGAVIVACRLLLLRPEAIVTAVSLVFAFVLGFIAPLVHGNWDWVLTFAGLALLAVTVVLIGLVAPARWAAALAAAVLVPLAWIAAFHGSYVAHLTGWRGLDVETFGSEDQPGLTNAWVTFILGTVIWAGFGIAAGVLAWFVHGARPEPSEPVSASTTSTRKKLPFVERLRLPRPRFGA